MAVLTEDDVRAIADYATIALDETELAVMTSYLNDAVAMLEPILDYAAEDVEPTFHPDGGIANVMRPIKPMRAVPSASMRLCPTPPLRVTASSAFPRSWVMEVSANGDIHRFPHRCGYRRGCASGRVQRRRGGPRGAVRHRCA